MAEWWRRGARDREHFGGNREVVIQRDGEQCVQCGMTRTTHYQTFGVDLAVDHINGIGRFVDVPDNRLENLQTLCFPCHGRKEQRKGKWVRNQHSVKTHCKNGHPFDAQNTLISPRRSTGRTYRRCRICLRQLALGGASRKAQASAVLTSGKWTPPSYDLFPQPRSADA